MLNLKGSCHCEAFLFAAVNSVLLIDCFGDRVVVIPKRLTAEEKTTRWKDAWFADVAVIFEPSKSFWDASPRDRSLAPA